LKEAQKKAQDALKQAKATKSYEEFGALAEKTSDDDWRVMMGDHKEVDEHKVTPEVWNTIKKMQVGQVSDLIHIGEAYTIVRLNARIEPGTQKFAVVKDALRKQLQQKKTEQLRTALDRRLRQSAKVEEL
jgi:parvulin-like peptidyl-prolyl isomerase